MFLRKDVDLKDLFVQTLDWNRVGNQGEYDFSDEKAQLQHRCLLEEVEELREALEERDEVEVLDALCDIMFVASYAHFMQMMDTEVEDIQDKGLDHNFVDITYTLDDLYTQLESLCEAKKYYTMIDLILRTSCLFTFDLKKAYANVVESNFSKFPLVPDTNLEEELEWFENESKYSGVIAISTGDRFVFRCNGGAGKIVKPRCFVEPELEQYIK